MKTNSKIRRLILCALVSLINYSCFAQWRIGINGLGDIWGETDPANKIDAIGIGDYFGNATQPAAALDITIPYLFNQGSMLVNQGEAIRSSAATDFNHTWKMYTFPETEKFRVENPSNSPDINLSVMQEKGILRLHTTDGLYGLEERMRFTYGLGGPSGNIGTTKAAISYGSGFPPIDQPQAILNLGHRSNLGSLGARKWMDVGTFMVDAEDQMYVGIKDDRSTGGADRGTAVINWGDNPTSGYGPDMLKFIFTSGLVTGSASDAEKEDGLEVARMTAYGNMGIGNIWNLTNILPKRRLDIWDNAGSPTSNPAHVNGPQLRLTHTPDATLTGGKWTDLETTGLGDFYIHTFDGSTNRNVGINTNIPGNTLEIKSNAGTAIPGSSGLRFTYLKTTSIPLVTNPFGSTTPAVLSVDNQGNVVLVKDETVSPTSGLNSCSSGIPDNFVFKMYDLTTNTVCKSLIYDDGVNVGIDVPSLIPLQKLDVNGNVNVRGTAITSGLYFNNSKFVSTGGPSSSNVYLGTSAGPTTAALTGYSNICIGGNTGTSMNSSETDNIMIGQNAGTNLSGAGVGNNTLIGRSAGLNVSNGLENTFIGYNAGTNYSSNHHNTAIGSFAASSATGVTGDNNTFVGYQASTTNGSTFSNSTAIGVYSSVDASDCLVLGNVNGVSPTNVGTRVLIGYTNPSTAVNTDFRLYVNSGANGHAGFFNGDTYNAGTYYPSDRILKMNIQPIQNSSAILNRLEPKTYNYDQINHPGIKLPSGDQFGLIAEDLDMILPGLTKQFTAPAIKDSFGNIIAQEETFKGVNYTPLIGLLIQGFKDQQQHIDSLMMRLNNLEVAMNACCSSSSSQRTSVNSIDIELTSENSIILNQNDPNPFAEQTRISFNVPTEVMEAKIIFFDNSGHILQTVKINERGAGQINVYGEKLSSGIYSFSLIADGKVIDTKKMVVAK